jgi:hypothetical protein
MATKVRKQADFYRKEAEKWDTKKVVEIWSGLKQRIEIQGWESGKSFEYMLIRAFQLDSVKVRWPYEVTYPQRFGTMLVHIVVEGETDAVLIKKVLADLRGWFTMIRTDGKDAARPIVRTILIQRHAPTAFVFDTNTTDEVAIENQTRSLTDYLSSRARPELFILIPMVPEIETLLFQGQVVRSRLRGPLDPAVEAAARVAPKAVLTQLLPRLNSADERSLINSLSAAEIVEIAKNKEIKRLKRFIEQER